MLYSAAFCAAIYVEFSATLRTTLDPASRVALVPLGTRQGGAGNERQAQDGFLAVLVCRRPLRALAADRRPDPRLEAAFYYGYTLDSPGMIMRLPRVGSQYLMGFLDAATRPRLISMEPRPAR